MWRYAPRRYLLPGAIALFVGFGTPSIDAIASRPPIGGEEVRFRSLLIPELGVLPPAVGPGPLAPERLADPTSGARARILRTEAVHRTLAWLDIVAEGGERGWCSGAIIGDGVVLTSAHCVAGSRSVRVVPGKDGADEPWGSQYADHVGVPAQWGFASREESARFDIGVVVLPDHTLTDKTGIFPGKLSIFPTGMFASNVTHVAAFGYPGDCNSSTCAEAFPNGQPDGAYAWALHPGFVKADEWFLYADVAGAPGMSGAPIVRESDMAIVGVFDSDLVVFSQGVRFREAHAEFLTTACSGSPSCSVTVEKPFTRTVVPALSADDYQAPPPLVGHVLYCAREAAYVSAVTDRLVELRDNLNALTSIEINATNFFTPQVKDEVARRAADAVSVAVALRALDPPDGRFAEFDSALDAGIDDTLDGLNHMSQAIATGNLSGIVDALAALAEADLHLATARSVYPSIDPSCLG